MKKITKLVSILVLGGGLFSCNTNELQDLNLNPQAVNQVDMSYLLSAAELGLASNGSVGDNRFIDWRTNIGLCGYAMQHLANAGGGIAPGDKYTENLESNRAPFDLMYGDQLKNTAEIIKQTGSGGFAEGKDNNIRQAARIIRAFSFCRLTDYYGNIPYSEANKGIEGIFFPKYDTQEFIYNDLFKELEEATAALNAAQGPIKGDFIFKGDVSKWKKWGYSLMLRMALRISNVDPAKAATYVSKAIAGGVMSSNADNVIVPLAATPSIWVNANGISRAFYPGDGGQPAFLSKTLVDWLKGKDLNSTNDDDPRLMVLCGGIGDWSPSGFTPIESDPLKQKGMPNGLDQADLDKLEGKTVNQAKTYSIINVKLLDLADPYMLMNYGEVELLLAEALERKIGTGIQGTAEEHYRNGVKASMQMYTIYDAGLTVSDAAVNQYLSQYAYGIAKPQLEMIYEQLWVNKFLNWWDAWCDWRRTGFPKLIPTNHPSNITGGKIPIRLRYPNAEVAGNPHFATTATLPDDYSTPVWWDK